MTSDVRNWLYGHDENLLTLAEFKKECHVVVAIGLRNPLLLFFEPLNDVWF